MSGPLRTYIKRHIIRHTVFEKYVLFLLCVCVTVVLCQLFSAWHGWISKLTPLFSHGGRHKQDCDSLHKRQVNVLGNPLIRCPSRTSWRVRTGTKGGDIAAPAQGNRTQLSHREPSTSRVTSYFCDTALTFWPNSFHFA